MADNCVRCGQKVKSEENWMRAHLWGNSAVLHWNCYIAVLKSESTPPSVEAAVLKGGGHQSRTSKAMLQVGTVTQTHGA
jgi:hypothetical protein